MKKRVQVSLWKQMRKAKIPAIVHKDNYLQGGRGIRGTLINQICLFQTCTLDAIILCKHHNVALAHSNIF